MENDKTKKKKKKRLAHTVSSKIQKEVQNLILAPALTKAKKGSYVRGGQEISSS